MLVLNKSLQKTRVLIYIRFSQVKYAQSGAILALFMEKPSTEDLVREYFDLLIKAIKSVDKRVIVVEVLKRWEWLKLYRMSLAEYLGKGKMKLFYQKIKFFTSIRLKTIPYQLVNKSQLKKCLKSGNKRRFVIVITVKNSTETSWLCSKGLRFGRAFKIVEKY